MSGNGSARERFLELIISRLTAPAPLAEDDVNAMLGEMADLVGTTGAYVILLERQTSGAMSITGRFASYATDAPAFALSAETLAGFIEAYRDEPFVVNDSQALPAAQKQVTHAMRDRGLRSALMTTVIEDEAVRGVVGFNHSAPRQWSGNDIARAEQLANMVVGALHKQRTEKAVVQAEERVRAYIEQSPTPVFCWELSKPASASSSLLSVVGSLGHARLVECSQAFVDEFASEQDPIDIGVQMRDLTGRPARAMGVMIGALLAHEGVLVDEQVQLDEFGETERFLVGGRLLFAGGDICRVWGSIRNVTESARLEQEVAVSRERIELAVSAGGLGFLEWFEMREQGQIELPAEAGASTVVHQLHDGHSLEDALGTLNVAALRQVLASAASDGRLEVEFDLPGPRVLRFLGRAIGDTVSDGRRVLGVLQDVTKIREAEAARRDLEEQMRRSQKLESLGVMAGGVAHDFNNLLTSIVGNAELARMDLPANSPSAESLRYVDKAAQVAADLCRQLLAYAGRGTVDTKAVDAAHTVGELRALLVSSVGGRATLNFDLGPTETFVVDVAQFQQIVLNLAINAGEALSQRPGTVMIRTGTAFFRRAELATPYAEKPPAAGRYTYVEVVDDGVGMDAETRERLFDPFYTTKFTGRGLGLSAVLGIVRAHGGTVQVNSVPGEGSTFRVLFPVATLPVASPGTEEPEAPVPLLGERQVLIVDDEDLVREVASRQLERLGFEVLDCSSGAEALELFDRHQSDIAFVLLDLTMPGMNGVETLRELRAVHRDARVVLMSGYSEAEAIRGFAGHQPDGFLHKPFSNQDLARRISSVLGG